MIVVIVMIIVVVMFFLPALFMPALLMAIPPSVIRAPAMLTLLAEFVTALFCLAAVLAVVANGFVELVLRLLNAMAAFVPLVCVGAGCHAKQQHRSQQERGSDILCGISIWIQVVPPVIFDAGKMHAVCKRVYCAFSVNVTTGCPSP